MAEQSMALQGFSWCAQLRCALVGAQQMDAKVADALDAIAPALPLETCDLVLLDELLAELAPSHAARSFLLGVRAARAALDPLFRNSENAHAH